MKIAILTCFMEFKPGYSLTGIVLDQCRMLTRHGHTVDLYVNEQFNPLDTVFPEGVVVKRAVPFSHLKDYTTVKDLTEDHLDVARRFADMLKVELQDCPVVFTHDLIFTGWNLPYALGIKTASLEALTDHRWIHWVHSIPSVFRDWWSIQDYGPKHRIAYPNKSDARRVAEQFRGLDHHVEVIPHIKDIRTWFDFCPDTLKFIDDFPGVLQSDIVQILPASTDRLPQKRVNEVILLFAKLKQRGLSVCLVVTNQWASQTKAKEDVSHYLKVAKRNGLVPMDEVIFTSEWDGGKMELGLPQRMVRELFTLSNLFVFPTREESFGLVVPEAALAGGCLLLLNKSLDCQAEISGWTTLLADFGSYNRDFTPGNGWGVYLQDLASIIVYRLQHNESIMAKTYFRQALNMDTIYRSYYEPVLAGSVLW